MQKIFFIFITHGGGISIVILRLSCLVWEKRVIVGYSISIIAYVVENQYSQYRRKEIQIKELKD